MLASSRLALGNGELGMGKFLCSGWTLPTDPHGVGISRFASVIKGTNAVSQGLSAWRTGICIFRLRCRQPNNLLPARTVPRTGIVDDLAFDDDTLALRMNGPLQLQRIPTVHDVEGAGSFR